MLPQNHQQKKVMDSMLRDYKIGKHFGSDTKKQGLMDLMVKHNITKDPRNMKDYQKSAFLKDVKSLRSDQLSIEGKRAFDELYGTQKSNLEKEAKMPIDSRNSYNEIMAKKNPALLNDSRGVNRSSFTFFGIGGSKNIKKAQEINLVASVQNKSEQERIEEVRSRIKAIES